MASKIACAARLPACTPSHRRCASSSDPNWRSRPAGTLSSRRSRPARLPGIRPAPSFPARPARRAARSGLRSCSARPGRSRPPAPACGRSCLSSRCPCCRCPTVCGMASPPVFAQLLVQQLGVVADAAAEAAAVECEQLAVGAVGQHELRIDAAGKTARWDSSRCVWMMLRWPNGLPRFRS